MPNDFTTRPDQPAPPPKPPDRPVPRDQLGNSASADRLHRSLAAQEAPGIADHAWGPDERPAEMADAQWAHHLENRDRFGKIGIESREQLADHAAKVINEGERIRPDQILETFGTADSGEAWPKESGATREVYLHRESQTFVIRNNHQGDRGGGTMLRAKNPDNYLLKQVGPRREDGAPGTDPLSRG